MSRKLVAIGAAFLAASTSAFSVQAGSNPSGEVLAFGGAVALDEGLEDRSFAGFNATMDTFNPDLKFELEFVGESREEDAAFLAVGFSRFIESGKIKALIGTSSDNDGIQPAFYAFGEYTNISPPEVGRTMAVFGRYRDYNNGLEDFTLGGNATFYRALEEDYQLVSQIFGTLSYNDPSGRTGYSLGGSITYGQYLKWTVGTAVEFGDGAYEPAFGGADVENSFISVRPFASYYLKSGTELIARFDFTNTDLYDAQGVLLGAKFRVGQ